MQVDTLRFCNSRIGSLEAHRRVPLVLLSDMVQAHCAGHARGGNCGLAARAFDLRPRDAVRSDNCLRNTTVWFVGNSVQRRRRGSARRRRRRRLALAPLVVLP